MESTIEKNQKHDSIIPIRFRFIVLPWHRTGALSDNGSFFNCKPIQGKGSSSCQTERNPTSKHHDL